MATPKGMTEEVSLRLREALVNGDPLPSEFTQVGDAPIELNFDAIKIKPLKPDGTGLLLQLKRCGQVVYEMRHEMYDPGNQDEFEMGGFRGQLQITVTSC